MQFKVIDHSSAFESVVNPVAAYARELRSVALAVDVETTGGSADAEVIELGAVRAMNGEVVIDERYCPSQRVQSFAYRIHGIGDAALQGKPRFAERYGEIAARLNGSVLLAWNAAQDARFLRQTCDRYGLPYIQAEWVCVMRLYQRFRELPKACKLEDACAAMGVKPGTHRALSDTLACARVLWRMAESAPEDEVIAREFWAEADNADEMTVTAADFLRSGGWQEKRLALDGQLIIRWIDPEGGAVVSLSRAMELQRARITARFTLKEVA